MRTTEVNRTTTSNVTISTRVGQGTRGNVSYKTVCVCREGGEREGGGGEKEGGKEGGGRENQ